MARSHNCKIIVEEIKVSWPKWRLFSSNGELVVMRSFFRKKRDESAEKMIRYSPRKKRLTAAKMSFLSFFFIYFIIYFCNSLFHELCTKKKRDA